MSTADSWKLLVFRDGQRKRASRELLGGLLTQIESVESLSDFASQFARDELIDALLRAGELECAVADQEGCHSQARALSRVTDALAQALVHGSRPRLEAAALCALERDSIPDALTVSTPEGFCYYALHPLDYVDLLNEYQFDIGAAAVIGIRSIGTTLSAIVRAWFEAKRIPADRITVRPTGHPFDRGLNLHANQRSWITGQLQRDSQFFIVDEGPGLSGSSFLSVAEALVQAGVSSEQIVLLPSSTPNFSNLLAQNAATRWSRFRTLALKPTRRIPEDAAEFVGGGEWRKQVFDSESEWPAVWSWTERQKYLSQDRQRIFRFDGHGPYGKEVRKRTEALAAHGWGPEVSSCGEGFSVSPWIKGSKLRSADQKLTLQLARYCAFRAEHFCCNSASHVDLEHMAQINLARGVGVNRRIDLPVERPVISDSRMMPYEWIVSSDDRLLKFDAASHGDDHFYPGPCDIAWDIAGAVLEWKLHEEAMELLINEYVQISGDRIAHRLPSYLIAYSIFRLGFSTSARQANSSAAEVRLFERDSVFYRNRLNALLNN